MSHVPRAVMQSCRLQLQLCVSRYVTRISNSRYKSLVYCTPPLTSTDGRTRPSVMRRWLRLRLTWVQNENPWTQNYRLRYLLTTTLHCTALYSDVPLNRLGHKRQKCEGRSEDSCPLLAHSAIQCRLDCRLPTFSHYIKRYVHHVNRAKDKRHPIVHSTGPKFTHWNCSCFQQFLGTSPDSDPFLSPFISLVPPTIAASRPTSRNIDGTQDYMQH